MTNEQRFRTELAEKQDAVKGFIYSKLRELIETSDKTSASGYKYITVHVFNYKRMMISNGQLMFMDEVFNTFHIDNGDCELSDFEDIISTELARRELADENARRKEAQLEQYDLAQEVIAKSGINIVTCGNCGSVNLHRVEDTEITCADCGLESEPCDFPDLFCV